MSPTSLLRELNAEAAVSSSPGKLIERRTIAKLAIVCICVLVWLTYTGSRSPWVRLNLPGGVHGGNPASGCTSLYNGDFYHQENFYALQHMDLLKGNYESFRGRIKFCDRRMFYAIAGNVLTLVFNSYHALRILNLAAFLLSVHFVRRMTELLFGNPDKGLLAAALFALSTLATVHVGDISPHFVALAFYYGWSLLMVRLADRNEPLSVRENLGHAALLGLWSLTYTSFAYGLVIYLLVLMRRKEWRMLLAPVVVCVVMPQLQLLAVRVLGFGHATDIEKLLASRGIVMHFDNFYNGPISYSLFLLVEFVNYLVNDNPLNVAIGVATLIAIRHQSKWMLCILYLAPIAVVFPFIGTTTARGYVVSGNTIVLFPLVAHGVFEAGRWLKARFGGGVGRVSIAAVLLVQFAWGQGSLVGWLYPTGSYAMGICKHSLVVLPTHFARMTGDADDKPTLHGGNKSAAEFLGLETGHGVQPIFPEQWLNPIGGGFSSLRMLLAGLMVELPVLVCVAGIVMFLRPVWWRRGMSVAILLLVPASLLFGATEGVELQSYQKFEDRIEVREGETLFVRVPLSGEFQRMLTEAARDNPNSQIHVHYRNVARRARKPALLSVFGSATNENQLTLPLEKLLTDIKSHSGMFECTLIPSAGSGGMLLRSWQRNRPEERRSVEILAADGTWRTIDRFPSLEVRVLRGDSGYPLKSLITQWDLTTPVGYELVGF